MHREGQVREDDVEGDPVLERHADQEAFRRRGRWRGRRHLRLRHKEQQAAQDYGNRHCQEETANSVFAVDVSMDTRARPQDSCGCVELLRASLISA